MSGNVLWTFDYFEVTGRLERGRIAPADREHLAGWLARFDGQAPVAFALEAGTGGTWSVQGTCGMPP